MSNQILWLVRLGALTDVIVLAVPREHAGPAAFAAGARATRKTTLAGAVRAEAKVNAKGLRILFTKVLRVMVG